MNAEIVLSSTDNLLAYKDKPVKVIPRVNAIKIQVRLNPKKGCGRVVREV